jgi:hypothetical protein
MFEETLMLSDSREAHLRQSVIVSSISPTRVKNFEESYLDSRSQIGAAEKIFKHFSAYEYREERNDNTEFGFNAVVSKGPLVEDSNWAPMWGWPFAVAMERHLLATLESRLKESVQTTNHLEPKHLPRQVGAFLDAADRLASGLQREGFNPGLIILATRLDPDLVATLEKRLDVPDWELSPELRTNWILGRHHDRLWLYIGEPTLDRIYAVDVQAYARLIQFDPPIDLAIDPIRADAGIDDYGFKVHLRLSQSYDIEVQDHFAVWAQNVETPSDHQGT